MKKRNSSLFLQLYLSIIATLIVIALLFILIMNYIDRITSINDFYRDAQQVATPIIQTLKQKKSLPLLFIPKRQQEGSFDISINNAEQKQQAIEGDVHIKKIDKSDIYQDKKYGGYIFVQATSNNRQWLIIKDRAAQDEDKQGIQKGIDPEERNLSLGLKITFVCLLFLFAVLLSFLIKRLNKHIDTLLDANEEWRQGKFSTRASENMPSPLDRLAIGFNQMANGVEKTFKQQNILMGAISHELRTPISKIQLSLSLLESQYSLKSDTQMTETHRYVDELTYLVDRTLTLAKLNHLEQLPASEPIDLTQIIQNRLDIFLSLHTEKKASFDAQEALAITRDRFYLTILIDNLLDNAFKYAKQQISLSLSETDNRLYFSVDDDGEGLSLEERETALAAFSRVDNSRNKGTGGYGLGLAIVDAIVSNLQGQINLESSQLGGLRITIYLPKNSH